MTIQAVVTHSPFVVRRRTVGDSFDLIARQETMSQTLLIPGLSRLNPNTLFSNGQPGGWADPYDLTRMWVDDAGTTPATIASLGTGIGRVITKGNAITLTQANAADRPVWGRHPVSGIRNLLERTEDLTNAYWRVFQSTVASAAVTPPSGLGSAFRAQELATTSEHRFENNTAAISVANGLAYTITIFAKAQQRSRLRLGFDNFGAIPGRAFFDLSNGTSDNVSAGTTASITNEGDGWYRCRVTATASSTTTTRLEVALVSSGTTVSYLGDTANGLLITAPQAELSATATTYQRVTNRFDITEVGSPSLYYFSGNGVNQRWASNATVNFSGVDKVTVWAGAQRMSNAARGTIVELTSSIASNNGAFHLTGPNAASDTFGWESKGTTLRDAVATVALGSPRRLVGVGDISGDLARLIVDGTATDNTGDQGSGNYSNATLHVFSRGGSSQFFNGRLYSLIIAGGLYDSRTIARFADWTTKPRRLIIA